MPIFGKKTLSGTEKEKMMMQAHNLQLAGEQRRIAKDLPAAQALYEQSLKCFRQVDEPLAMGRVLQGLGMIQRDQRHFREAESSFNEALELFRGLYDSFHQGTTVDRIATMYYMMGDSRKACEKYLQAGALLVEGQAFPDAVAALSAGGALQMEAGAHAEAESTFRRTLDLIMQNRVSKEEPHLLYQLGTALVALKRGSEAIPLFTRVMLLEDKMHANEYAPAANEALEKMGAQVTMGTAELAVTNAELRFARDLFQGGQPQPAIARLKALLESSKETSICAQACEMLGGIYKKLGQTGEALSHYEKALALYTSAGMQDGVGRVVMVLGILQQDKDEFVL